MDGSKKLHQTTADVEDDMNLFSVICDIMRPTFNEIQDKQKLFQKGLRRYWMDPWS